MVSERRIASSVYRPKLVANVQVEVFAQSEVAIISINVLAPAIEELM